MPRKKRKASLGGGPKPLKPRDFILKGHQWRVEYKWSLHLDGMPCHGICDFERRVIQLNRLDSAETKASAFKHELVHATLFEAHLSENGGVDGFVEEVVCESVRSMLDELFEVRWKRQKA